MLNLKAKVKSYAFWLAIIALVKFGATLNLFTLPGDWETAAMQVLLALVAAGVISDNSKGRGFTDK